MSEKQNKLELRRNGDMILCYRGDRDGDKGVPVRLAWARPLTGRGSQVTVMHARKKEEVALLDGFEHLDETSRAIIEEELERRYFMPQIRKVLNTSILFGSRYWRVETDRGPRQFLMKSPETNTIWITDDHCLLRDTMGNCYEIESFERLDRASRAHADKVL
ncbi:MAG: DUF1854 domain-containing protein [Planctomycetes bacterium]|nr:DUF1854 domain-containing protein [Planctomycetota bacterium]